MNVIKNLVARNPACGRKRVTVQVTVTVGKHNCSLFATLRVNVIILDKRFFLLR